MPTSLLTDPFRLWREAVTRLEADLNTLANAGMSSPELAAAVHRYNQATLGVQHMFEKVLRSVFAKLDLPSRSEIAELNANLHRIEDKLDRLLPAESAAPAGPRPARTRRPPEEASATPAAKRAASPPAKAPARRARKPARNRS